jgi:hypothetical protein
MKHPAILRAVGHRDGRRPAFSHDRKAARPTGLKRKYNRDFLFVISGESRLFCQSSQPAFRENFTWAENSAELADIAFSGSGPA